MGHFDVLVVLQDCPLRIDDYDGDDKMRGFTILLLMATAVMAQPETIDLPLN